MADPDGDICGFAPAWEYKGQRWWDCHAEYPEDEAILNADS